MCPDTFPSLPTDLVHYHPDDEHYSFTYVVLDRDEINPDDGKVDTYQLEETVRVIDSNSGRVAGRRQHQ